MARIMRMLRGLPKDHPIPESDSLLQLLETGKDGVNSANAEGVAALHVAAQNGFKKCMELLLEARADLEQARNDGVAPLALAAEGGHYECMVLTAKLPRSSNS